MGISRRTGWATGRELAFGLGVALGLACPITITATAAETGHHVRDVGIFPDLDGAVRITLPAKLDPADVRLVIDARHRVILLRDRDVPLKAYPLCGTATLPPGAGGAAVPVECMNAEDATELRGLVSRDTPVEIFPVGQGRGPSPDADDDGIPDALDLLMGARKLVANGAAYTEGYFRISYPGGDVPRSVGVCSDTIVRSFRNAGIDLQTRVAEDIRADRSAYPGVVRPNASIDHRRVKNLLRWFLRHVPEIRTGPQRPGDVVFLDTFRGRPGPDHVGIISDRLAPSGLPFVINNWTVGMREGEMDLLPGVPVTHRFRLK